MIDYTHVKGFKKADSYSCRIFIAGDYDKAKGICQEYCSLLGCCVTVTKTSYIYTGGAEEGVIVELINYPRFPLEGNELLHRAEQLAGRLVRGLFQKSYTIQSNNESLWVNYVNDQ